MNTNKETRRIWNRIYRYARQRGKGHHDAEDLAQSLFLKLCSGGSMERMLGTAESDDHAEALLFITAKRILLDVERRRTALKRGGATLQEVDFEVAGCEAGPASRPDRALQSRETAEAIDRTRRRLREEYRKAGKGRTFTLLKDCLDSGRAGIDMASIAQTLGLKSGTLRVQVSRMRARFRELVSLELAA